MREIKFRGYSTKDNEWRYGFYVTDNITHEILTKLENNEMYASQIDFISLGQYTGLKDKNGIEIYEGDIMKTTDKKENEVKQWLGVVEDNNFGGLALKYKEYLNPSWLGALSSPINEPQTATWVNSTCEVIGNIYENIELLKD